MAPTREAAWNSFFFREERSWGPWQHPSSLFSLRLVSLLVELGRTMGLNKQLARWCLSKGVGFVDNWNFSLGISQRYRRARLHFNQTQADKTISRDNYLCAPPPSPPKPVDADLGSEKQRIPWAKKNILPNTTSRKQKAKCYLFRSYQYLQPHS